MTDASTTGSGTIVGSGLFKSRGWISAAIFLPIALLSIFSAPWTLEGTWADVCVDLAGWLVLGAGIFIRLWATLYIGGRKSMALVTDGPYALCRHPLYVASFLIVLALGVFLLSLSIMVAGAALAVVYALVVVPSEERHAIACFGDAYRQYASTTPRFFPRWRRAQRPGMLEIKVAAFLREYARTYGFIALGAAADCLAYLRSQPWWPTPFHLP